MAIVVQITGDTAEVDAALNRLKASVTQSTSAVQGAMASATQATQQMSQRAQQHLDSLSTALQRTGAATATALSAFERLRQAQASGDSASALMSRGLQGLSQQVVRSTVEQGNLSKAFLQTGQAAQTAGTQFEQTRSKFVVPQTWQQGLTALSQTVTKNTVEQGNLGKAFLQTGQAAQTQKNQFEQLRQQYVKTQQGLTIFGGSLKEIAAAIGIGFGINAAINALKAFGTAMLDASLKMDSARLSLAAVTGSTKAAQAEMDTLRAIADRTGVGIDVLAQQWAGLFAAVSQVPGRLQETRGVFDALIETGVRLGKSTSQIEQALYGLTQLAGGATVQLDELARQLGDQLPGLMPALAREMGVTAQELRKMATEGKLLVDDVLPKMEKAIRSLASGSGPVSTLQASFGYLRTAWTEFLDAIGQLGPIQALRGVLIGLTFSLNQVAAAARFAREAFVGISDARLVANAMQNIDARIAETNKSLENMKKASTTGIGGFINDLLGLDQQKALATKEQELKDLQAAQEALRASQKAAGPTEGLPAPTGAEQARTKLIQELEARKNTTADFKKELEGIDKELSAIHSKDVGILLAVGLDPLLQSFAQDRKQAETRLLKARAELLDKMAGLDKGAGARAVQEAGESAVERAKAVEDALAVSLTRQEAMIKQSADEQRRLTDEAASKALAEEGPSGVEAIAAKRLQDLRTITVQEAELLEDARQKNLDLDAKAREVRLQAEIAAAGKNLSAATKAQEELSNLSADTEAQRVKIRAQTEDALQKVSKKSVDDQIEQARAMNKIIQEIEQDRLKARIDLVDEQIALVKAQMDGEVITTQEGLAQIQALHEQRFATMRLMYEEDAQREIAQIDAVVQRTKEGSDEQVAAKALAAEQTRQVNEGLNAKLQSLNLQQETQQQEHLNELSRGWREWVNDVRGALGDFLFRWMDGQIHGIKDLLNDLKSYFFRLIADMVAYAATRAIVIPMVTAVLGGGGGVTGTLGQVATGAGLLSQFFGGGGSGGGMMDMGGQALAGIGLAKQLYSYLGIDWLTSSIGTGLSSLKETFLAGIDSLFKTSLSAAQQASDEAALLLADATGDMGRGTAGAAAGGLGTGLTIAGGLAALGAGIYGALNASNNAAKAAYAASAAAGAAAAGIAAYSALMVAAGGTAVGTGWTGIGLIVAAVMAVIGTVLNMVIKPAGPNLAVGQPAGIDVGEAGGKLVVRGQATSNIIREEGVSPGQTSEVQQALNEVITDAVTGIIQTINAVALDPAKLLGPTQDALRHALAEVQTINSASARHMEKDIAEQLRFTNTAIIANMLDPVNMAFEQLIDSDLKTQIDRLPVTTIGLVEIFKTLNAQLDEMAKGENRDVLGQLQGTREAIARFGQRLAQTAGRTAEEIVNGVIDEFTKTQAELPKLTGIADPGKFSQNLGKLITAFNDAMTDGLTALATLKKTQQTLESVGLPGEAVGSQVGRLITMIGEQSAQLSEQIVTGALAHLADQLQAIVVQPIRIQATTVDSLFTDSLAALQSLQLEWARLNDVGIDSTKIQEQFTRLLDGMLSSARTLLTDAIQQGTFPEFLDVLLSIPDALAKLNPVFERLKALGQAFAQVVGPIQQTISQGEESLRTPAERVDRTAQQMRELEAAIADAGTSAEKALPLYAQLADAIMANAAAQIAAVQQIGAVIEQITTILDARLTTSERLAKVNQDIADLQAGRRPGDQTGVTPPWLRISDVSQPGQGLQTIEDLSQLVTLYGQQLDLLAQLRDAIAAGLTGIDETLRADETVSQRAARLVAIVTPRADVMRPAVEASPEALLRQASALQDAIGAVRELIDVIEQGLQQIQDILHATETTWERATRLVAAVPTQPTTTDPESLLKLAGAISDALGAVRELIATIQQGIESIQQTLHATETTWTRAMRLVAELHTPPGDARDPAILLNVAQQASEALTAVRALIEQIQQGIESIQQTLHATESVSARATRLVAELHTPPGDARDPSILLNVAQQATDALTAVRALMDMLQSGIDSIDSTLFSLLSVAEQAADLQAKIAAINTDIATAGQATPEQLIKLVGLTQQALSLQQQITKALESTLADLQSSFVTTPSPAVQLTNTREQIATLQAVADTGAATPEQLQKLVDLNQQLLSLGEQFDLLDVQQEALDALQALAPVIQAQIEASKARETELIDNLKAIKGQLEDALVVAQSTEAQLIGLLISIEARLKDALTAAQVTETALVGFLTTIQGQLKDALIIAQTTEQQLTAQLINIQSQLLVILAATKSVEAQLIDQLGNVRALLAAQMLETQAAEALTIRYLDAQLAQLQAQLIAQYGTANVDLIVKQIQEWALAELRLLNERLRTLFLQQPDAQTLFGIQGAIDGQTPILNSQDAHLNAMEHELDTVINKLDDVNRSLNTPLRTVPAMQGGFIALQMGGPLDQASLNHAMTGPLPLARGGMVAAILEPGERVFPPPFTSSQKHALTAMNTEFPRMSGGGWTVPGHGSGDHVPALLSHGSFVLNREASHAAGYQGGGDVFRRTLSEGDRLLTIRVDLGSSIQHVTDELVVVEAILADQLTVATATGAKTMSALVSIGTDTDVMTGLLAQLISVGADTRVALMGLDDELMTHTALLGLVQQGTSGTQQASQRLLEQWLVWNNREDSHVLTAPEDAALFGMYEELQKHTAIMQTITGMSSGGFTTWPHLAGGGWTVPGSREGDHVPAMLPMGSFVLNKHATRAMGHQGGGFVSGTPAKSGDESKVVHIHVDLRGSQFSKNITLEEFKALLRELERRGLTR